MRSFLFIFLTLLTLKSYSASPEEVQALEYIPRVKEIPAKDKAINFGLVYGAQWAYYLTLQRHVIDDHGSFKNWHQNMFSPHFDKDSFDWNIFKHGLTGNFYYLFYRSRGYDRVEAFTWTFLSSLAFEFTIETATERPSYQDIYQTPVYGTVLGIGMENLSHYFHEKDNWWGHTLGYLFNPFTLLPDWGEQKVSLLPMIDHRNYGAMVSYEF